MSSRTKILVLTWCCFAVLHVLIGDLWNAARQLPFFYAVRDWEDDRVPSDYLNGAVYSAHESPFNFFASKSNVLTFENFERITNVTGELCEEGETYVSPVYHMHQLRECDPPFRDFSTS